MAVLTSANVVPVLLRGDADLIALYALRDVTTGDTIDLTTLGTSPNFQVIQRGTVLGVSAFVEIAATFTGTVVTMPAGLNKDSGYLTVWGC
jgi:hypothetical protein